MRRLFLNPGYWNKKKHSTVGLEYGLLAAIISAVLINGAGVVGCRLSDKFVDLAGCL